MENKNEGRRKLRFEYNDKQWNKMHQSIEYPNGTVEHILGPFKKGQSPAQASIGPEELSSSHFLLTRQYIESEIQEAFEAYLDEVIRRGPFGLPEPWPQGVPRP